MVLLQLCKHTFDLSDTDCMIQEMQGPDMTNDAADHRFTESTHRGRSRSPGNRASIGFPLPQKPHAPSSNTRVRPRSPPLSAERSNGRFPSPGSARHRFVRERNDRQHMTDDRYRAQQSSPQSPNARFGSRGDYVHQQSPASRRYSDNYQNWTRNGGSPNTSRERAAPRPDIQASEVNRNAQGTVDFDGLRDVPTGPRRSISGANAPKRDCVTSHPCISISLRYVPNLPNLIRHLKGMLGHLKPSKIEIDDYGWNLIYDDSSDGLAKLARCYEKYNKALFFGEYELIMQCHPNGKQPRTQRDTDLHSSGGSDANGRFHSSLQRPDTAMMPKFAGFEKRQITYPEPIRSLETRGAIASSVPDEANAPVHTPHTPLPHNLAAHLPDVSRPHDVPPTGTNTSLLSVRSDRDETGSLASGVTRSDGSRVKRDRCHRCKGDAVPGASTLVRCSTCPRQYHRRCHPDPKIPDPLVDDHIWSCAPCVKKGRAGKEKPRQDSSKPISNPKMSVPETDTVPERVPDKEQRVQATSHSPVTMDVNNASNTPLDLLRSDSKSPQNEFERQGDTPANTKSSITKDEHAVLSDADDLVAKSFAAAEDQLESRARSQKSGKLKITRTKLPPKPRTTTPQQSPIEAFPVQGSTTVANLPPTESSNSSNKDADTVEVVARNSVADLRALAHERHQTAIKNGPEGHFVSEEQRRLHAASSNQARSSPANQPPDESRPPQQPVISKPTSAASTVSKHTAEPEIPESPDEVRRGELKSDKMTRDPRLMARPRGAVSQSPVISHGSLIQAEKPPTMVRPTVPSVVKCEICQKKILKGPSGKNTLCSACKKDVAAAAAAEGPVNAKLAPWTSATIPLHKSVAPVANMVASPTKVIDPVDLGVQSVESPVLDLRKKDVPTDDESAIQGHKSSTQPISSASSSSKARPRAKDGTKNDDSDVQKAVSSEPEERHIVQNTLAARILGELQFSPTVQKLLHSEPSISDWKIRLLKKVLDENETARTDDAVLTVQLEHALTDLRQRSHPPDQVLGSIDSTSIGDAESTEVEKPEAAASQSRLNFIKSVVGDSFERPKGSRLILVAMALGSTAARRMQAKDVMEWIASTIPTYTKGEGNWTSRISAQLSQGRVGGPGTGHWREEEWQEGDGGKPKGKWYQLLPEKEDEMWTWCPVLKEPLSPSSRREANKTRKAAAQRVPARLQTSTTASTSAPVTPISSMNESVSTFSGSSVLGEDSKHVSATSIRAAAGYHAKIDGSMVEDLPPSARGQKRKRRSSLKKTNLSTPKNGESSSEEEPLSAVTKRIRGEALSQDRTRLRTVQQHTPTNQEFEDQSEPEPEMSATKPAEHGRSTDGVEGNVNHALATSVKQKKSGMVTLYLHGAKESTNASDHQLPANREHLATSLYDEWPEYRPQAFDEHEKLAEIRERPKKKKLFGRPAARVYARSQTEPFDQAITPYNASPEKRSRTTMVDPTPDEPYPWENPDIDPTRKEYKSLEEFFDFPDNMIPIISEGQLAYRDGTRTDDGRLPRAREIYKP